MRCVKMLGSVFHVATVFPWVSEGAKIKSVALSVTLGCTRRKGTVPILGVLTELY